MGALPWTILEDGVRVTVRLTPKGGRDALDDIGTLADGRSVLQARVRAAPSEGEANAALIALLAKTLRLPKRAVQLETGATARLKHLKIEGEPGTITARLEQATRKRASAT